MKHLLLSLLLSAALAAPALAQDQDRKDIKKDHAAWDKKVKDELQLTDEQTVKYDALNKEYADKTDALKQDATLSKDAQKERKIALKKEKEAKLNEFLTTDQQARYRDLIEKKKKDMSSKPAS